MDRLDYKFRQVIRDGRRTSLTVVFYVGADVAETDADGNPVTVYRRSAVAQTHHLQFSGDVSDEDLRAACNQRLAALLQPTQQALPQQRVTRPSTARLLTERVDGA